MRAVPIVAALLVALALAGCSGRAGGDASIHGMVVNGQGSPLANAAVSLDNGDETTTASDGAFHFTDLAAKEYTVHVEADGKTSDTVVQATTAAGFVTIRMR